MIQIINSRYIHTAPTGIEVARYLKAARRAYLGNPKNPVNPDSDNLPSNRFPETQYIPVMVLEFKRVETLTYIRDHFGECKSTGLKLSKQRVRIGN